MMSTFDAILTMSQNTIRELVALNINERFVQVTNTNLGNYYLLKVISSIGNLIPIIFIVIGMIPTRSESEEQNIQTVQENKDN